MYVLHLLWIITWALFVQGAHYDFGLDTANLTQHRGNGSRILVEGLPVTVNGSVPHRLDIRQMRNDPYQWDLFILALSMLQSVNQSDPLSWYQIAGMFSGCELSLILSSQWARGSNITMIGIHGLPFRTWNRVEPVTGGASSGYCTHSSVLFPMWHRPYLVLVEVRSMLAVPTL